MAQTCADVTDNPVRTSRAAHTAQPGRPCCSHEPNAGLGLSITPCLQTPLRRPYVAQVVATLGSTNHISAPGSPFGALS